MSSELPKHGVTGLALKEEDVELFMDYIIDKEPQEAKIHTGGTEQKNASVRDAEIYFIDYEAKRLYAILSRIAKHVNQYFGYEIDGIEKAQVIRYKSPSKGYEYHIDLGPEGVSATRKISVSLLLNDKYEGGEICFRTGESASCTKPKVGEVVAFSSFLPHKVKPITKGERYVLVAWFTGPPFR
jgi:PKHD-type hydroxylase|tara:strand:- start:30 stop:581 length:552 start_codon:yes stop_codon:yes gene_type:complete